MSKIFVGLLAILISLSSCTKKNDDGGLAVFHGSFIDDIKSLDPASAYDTLSLDILPSIYETLYQYSYLAIPYAVEPLLAADMPKFSADRLTVTIPIRQGIHFQDDACFKANNGKGRELKAQDFVYAFKRLALPSPVSAGFWILSEKVVGVNAFHDKIANADKAAREKIMEEPLEGVRALDDYTLQIKLTKPYPQILYVLAMGFSAPVAHEVVEAYGDDKGSITEHPVGTGPFTLKTWDRGRQIVLDRNPTFHTDFYPTKAADRFRERGLLADAGARLPMLDRVSINIIKEHQPSWLNFMKGNQDVVAIPRDSFSQAIANSAGLSPQLAKKGIQLNIETGTHFYYISFNAKDKIVGQNKALRQAMSSAINREKWIEIFTNKTGMKAGGLLPPRIPDRPQFQTLKYDYNLERARELMKKAGYPEGKGLPELNFDLRGANTANRQLGEFFAQQFAAIGIRINVIYNTLPSFLEKGKTGNLQVFAGGWAMDYPDAENVFQLLYGPNRAPGTNDSNFDNAEFNKLYEQIAVMDPSTKRAELVHHMDDIVQEECIWALGYYHAAYELTQPWLLNYRGSSIINNKFKYFRIDRELKAKQP